MTRNAIVLAVLLLAACAPMQWVKPDASAEQLGEDMKMCQDAAWREATWRSGRYVNAIGPMVYQDSVGRRLLVWPYGPFADPSGDRFMEESRLADYCMRSKGYELAPVKR